MTVVFVLGRLGRLSTSLLLASEAAGEAEAEAAELSGFLKLTLVVLHELDELVLPEPLCEVLVALLLLAEEEFSEDTEDISIVSIWETMSSSRNGDLISAMAKLGSSHSSKSSSFFS